MRFGNSTTSRPDTATSYLGVLVGGRIDSKTSGIQNQRGDARFLHRFALRTHTGYDPTSAMKFAMEHQNPLLVGPVGGGDAYPEASFSIISASDPDVHLCALKQSEEGIGAGVIARFWSMADSGRKTRVTLSARLAHARATTHLETDVAALPRTDNSVTIPFASQQIRTLRLIPGQGR